MQYYQRHEERPATARFEHIFAPMPWQKNMQKRERTTMSGVCRGASFGDSAVPIIPDTISYGALLMVINERLKLQRTMEEQQYFVDLANRLIQLYWQQIDDEQKNSQRRRAA